MQNIQIAILDAHALTRSGLHALVLRAGIPLHQIASFADMKTLSSHLEQHRVNLLLLVDEPAHTDVAGLVSVLHRAYPAVAMVVVSARLQVDYIRRLFASGARGFIYRTGQIDEAIAAAIKTLGQGAIYLSPEAAALPYIDPAVPSQVDTRDLDVLRLLAQGYKVKEVALSLQVDRRVVYRTRDKLRRLLRVSNNEQLIAAALASGLLEEKTPRP